MSGESPQAGAGGHSAAPGGHSAASGKPDPPTTGSQPAVPQTQAEQLEGLRAWMAQIDRRLAIRSWAGGIAIVLALAAGIVGVVLATSAKDESATKTEVESLRDQISATTKEASQAARDSVAQLRSDLDALDTRVSTIASAQRTSDSEINVAQDDIDELRGQISDLQDTIDSIQSSSSSSTGGNGGN